MIKTKFDAADMKEFEAEAKVGLLATINLQGLPHVTLITTLQAKSPERLIWGQFTEGLSKEQVKINPNTAFLIMNLKRRLWRGKAVWTGEQKEGADYEMFNAKPMFRYNSYFGIHTVHYMDLVEVAGPENLPLARIAVSAAMTLWAKSAAKVAGPERVLNFWSERFFNRLDTLKYLAYVAKDGFSRIIPIFSCRAADAGRLVFSPLAYASELRAIPQGAPVAVYGMSFNMETILARGIYRGVAKYRFTPLAAIDLDWVYNSMPPKQGQIYPPVELKPVVNF